MLRLNNTFSQRRSPGRGIIVLEMEAQSGCIRGRVTGHDTVDKRGEGINNEPKTPRHGDLAIKARLRKLINSDSSGRVSVCSSHLDFAIHRSTSLMEMKVHHGQIPQFLMQWQYSNPILWQLEFELHSWLSSWQSTSPLQPAPNYTIHSKHHIKCRRLMPQW